MLEGLPRTWLLPQQYFVRNTQLKANIVNTNLYPPLNCDLHTGSGIGASSSFHPSHLLPCCCFFSGIEVVFRTSPEPSSAVLAPSVDGFLFHSLLLLCVVSNGLFACFCHKMTFYQPGAYDHGVLYTTAQLTEGRSARDQPKQPPATKKW